jgi:DNA invertase Pin-like site-specific DNA recombinase
MRNGDMAKDTKLTIGYARASTDDQSTEVQREQLEAAGCSTVLSENVINCLRPIQVRSW